MSCAATVFCRNRQGIDNGMSSFSTRKLKGIVGSVSIGTQNITANSYGCLLALAALWNHHASCRRAFRSAVSWRL